MLILKFCALRKEANTKWSLSSTSTVLCNFHNAMGVAKEAHGPWPSKYVISTISLAFCYGWVNMVTSSKRKQQNYICVICTITWISPKLGPLEWIETQVAAVSARDVYILANSSY